VKSDAGPVAPTSVPLTWELRVSRRARYAKLQIKPYGGLEVVIPTRFPRHQVPQLVEKHANWIRRQLEKQAALCESIELPRQISLAFDQSTTRIAYASDNISADSGPHLHIAATDYHGRVKMLRAWLRKKAWTDFPAMLESVALRTGLGYRKLGIRSQKTRWGSCSIRGSISLNDQLLFLPRATVEYLMIHELCHTRYLNHSRAFWELVEVHCPGFHQHERQLNQARHIIPQWFLRDLYR
jgi:hypothetical protein